MASEAAITISLTIKLNSNKEVPRHLRNSKQKQNNLVNIC